MREAARAEEKEAHLVIKELQQECDEGEDEAAAVADAGRQKVAAAHAGAVAQVEDARVHQQQPRQHHVPKAQHRVARVRPPAHVGHCQKHRQRLMRRLPRRHLAEMTHNDMNPDLLL